MTTVIIPATTKSHKQRTAAAADGVAFTRLVAEHVYGDAFCRNYATGLPGPSAAEHARWVQVLQTEAAQRGKGELYNDGVRLALERLPQGA